MVNTSRQSFVSRCAVYDTRFQVRDTYNGLKKILQEQIAFLFLCRIFPKGNIVKIWPREILTKKIRLNINTIVLTVLPLVGGQGGL